VIVGFSPTSFHPFNPTPDLPNSGIILSQKPMKYRPTTLAILLLPASLHAASDTWINPPLNTSWADGLNWVGGTAPGATSGTTNTDTATFGTSSGLAVTVDTGRNIQNITFGANNTYTLSGGSLLLTSGGKILANGSSATQNIGSALQIQGDGGSYTFQTDTPGTSRLFTLSGAVSGVSTTGKITTLNLEGTSGTNNIVSGVISDGSAGGQLAIVKSGTGTWSLATGNTFSGGLTVNGGTLRTGNSGNTNGIFGTGTVTMGGGSILLGSTSSTTFNNAIVVNTGTSFMRFRASHFFNPASMSGTGTLELGHTSSTANTVSSSDFKNFSGTIRVVQNGTAANNLRMSSGYVETSLQNAVLDLQTNTNFNHQAGTNNTITTHIGTLAGVSGSFVGGSGAGSGTFVFSVGSRNEDSVFSGVIGNGGTKSGLTKVGSGKLTLDGTSTYTGTTTVSAGTLLVNGALGNTAVNVTGGTLGGTGTIGGAVTVSSGAFLAPGASIESLEVASAVINGTLVTEYDGTGLGTIDLLTVTGALDITNATVDFNLFGTALDDASYVFATYGSLIGSSFFSEIDVPTGYQIDYAFGGNNIALVAVPEPAAAFLGSVGLLALLGRRRRR
jgi:autotransporter-associated beta strand protein